MLKALNKSLSKRVTCSIYLLCWLCFFCISIHFLFNCLLFSLRKYYIPPTERPGKDVEIHPDIRTPDVVFEAGATQYQDMAKCTPPLYTVCTHTFPREELALFAKSENNLYLKNLNMIKRTLRHKSRKLPCELITGFFTTYNTSKKNTADRKSTRLNSSHL